tara:strand:+ start:32707 stop:33618 length:912 start_codon:yes stop_codon:yes gene_type:complete
MAIDYYIALQEPSPRTDQYSEDDLYSLARKQRGLGLELVLFETESKAESEAETNSDRSFDYIICRVTVTNDEDNEDLADSIVRAGQLSYLAVCSIVEARQDTQQHTSPMLSPSQSQVQDKHSPQAAQDDKSNKVSEAPEVSEVSETSTASENIFYVVLHENNPKEDVYSINDFTLLAKAQRNTILIQEEAMAKELAQYRFDNTGKTQLICKIKTDGVQGDEARVHIAQTETLVGNLLKIHEKLELIDIKAITKKSENSKQPLNPAAPIHPGFTSALALQQRQQEQQPEAGSSAARVRAYIPKK